MNKMLKTISTKTTVMGFALSGFLMGHTSTSIAEEAGPSLGIVGAASMQNPNVNKNGNSVSVDGSTAWGGGLTAEMDIAPGFGLEADLLYLSHKFSQNTAEFFGSSVSTTYTSGYLHVPVLVRYRPIPFVNLGAGLYYSRVVKGWSVSADGHSDTSTDFGKNDWGMALAIGSVIPLNEKIGLSVDLRYARSLTDTSRTSGDAMKFSDFQVLAGVRFGLY